jgi:hypothetical protein
MVKTQINFGYASNTGTNGSRTADSAWNIAVAGLNPAQGIDVVSVGPIFPLVLVEVS